ncbi:hypothetical protein GCM10009081_22060 [Brevundimonas nasdae]
MFARLSQKAAFPALTSPTPQQVLSLGMVGLAAVVIATTAAVAGTDNTFQQADTFITNFISGTGGKTIAGIALISAVINIAIKFNWIFFGSAIAVGLACGIGPNIVSSFFTGVF